MMSRYASLKQGLVGAWCPSLGASGYRLLDRSGNNNHGTLTNMDPGTDWVPSGNKLSLDFDGVDDYVDAGKTFQLTGDFSVCFWFNVIFPIGNKVALGSLTDANPFFGNLNNQQQMHCRANASTLLTFSVPTIASSTWHFVVYSRSSGNIRCILDNVESTTGAIAENRQFDINAIAGYPTASVRWIGKLDDIRIYNRALTPQEIRLLYTGGRGVGLMPERIKHRRKTTASATNRRRRLICGANC